MRKIHFIVIFLCTSIFAQSINDLRRITNEELDRIRSELQSQVQESIVQSSDITSTAAPVSITSTAIAEATGDFFGYNYFRKDISFFDNIPTPSNYILGPGDQVVLTMWGETNFRTSLTIDKDGTIYFENLGFINISNLTVESAQKKLKKELSKIYSTLNDQNALSDFVLSLGSIKSINVYFTGYVANPGINLIHPFSDLYSAIVQAGGIDSRGSLREINLIRNGKVIQKTDFYSFFIDGNNTFKNIKLVDGDIIHVPLVKKRVTISGAVLRPGSFELMPNENFDDLLNFSSGLIASASSDFTLSTITPISERISDDNAKTTLAFNLENKDLIKLNNGDTITVPFTPDVLSTVNVRGQVKRSGTYPAESNSLKDILDLAGGFNDPVFRKSIMDNEIIILRKDESNPYAIEFIVAYDSASSFSIMPGDEILVYANSNYQEVNTFIIGGEVKKPGIYSMQKGLTLKDAIVRAGGITEFGSINSVSASLELLSYDINGEMLVTRENVVNLTPDFVISNNMSITILPKTNVVRVFGNVYNPGFVALNGESINFRQAIELSGGYSPRTLKRDSYIIRSNGKIERIKAFRLSNKRLFSGDSVIIPAKTADNDFDPTIFVSELTSIISNIAAILLIIDSTND